MLNIRQITVLDADLLFQLLNLARRIKGLTCTLSQYAKYLNDYFSGGNIYLVGAFDNNNLLGFLHVESPHPLTPDCGALCLAAGQVRKEIVLGAMKLAEEWLKKHGATKWETKTKRNPLVWKRRYGFNYLGQVGDEYVLGKNIK